MSEPFVQDADFTLWVGDVRDVLSTLEDGSVDCVVTSPPYWALRDYGTGQWEGGDPDCDHKGVAGPGGGRSLNGSWDGMGGQTHVAGSPNRGGDPRRCRCGATRVDLQLGLEDSPDAYVETMVRVFREVRRVLADHGTCWLNLGDSYNSYAGNRGLIGSTLEGTDRPEARPRFPSGHGLSAADLKPKDLVGVPWRVAFALQSDGWWIRSDVIWSKPNPMPESVTDRPTKAHEYLFMLTKSGTSCYWVNAQRGTLSPTKPLPDYWWVNAETGEWREELIGDPLGWKRVNAWRGRDYFFDQEAVRERYQPSTIERDAYGYNHAFANQFKGSPSDKRHPDGKVLPAGSFAKGPDGRKRKTIEPAAGTHENHQTGERDRWPNGGRNIRSVWETDPEAYARELADVLLSAWQIGMVSESDVWRIATQPYADAHFAVFPEALPERCLKAGCPEWVCGSCGKPRERIVGRLATGFDGSRYGERAVSATGGAKSGGTVASTLGSSGGKLTADHETLGWSDCGHNNYRPGRVLDPFMGSGTTALVARRLGRHAVGIELNPEYAALCAKRLQQLSLFA